MSAPGIDAHVELTTVADDLAVFHDGEVVHRHEGLAPDTTHELHGISFRTLARPSGELLCRFATVNDVHFGETECGVIDGRTDGPIVRPEPGDDPYPEVMNRCAADEMAGAPLDAVIVKGDLSKDGLPDEWASFEHCYRRPFGDRLHVVRGNHDAHHGQHEYAGDQWIDLPGITIGLLDTVVPTLTTGALTDDQIASLDDHLAGTHGPVVLMGHHQQWIPSGPDSARSLDYFGLHPDSSEALDDLAVRHPGVIAYTAGHTHRHRLRTMRKSGIASIEIGCVKDFPGTWAEYRVYEGGVMQVVHRMSAPEALAWSERCRMLYSDFGVDYASYALGKLEQRCFVLPVLRT